ncbi:MAG: hypothetical protein QOE71_3874 [Pseudonocardiales bacterium]|nr:hypothetical protein [Pseudonocardiales bacterium]MDQ1752818.1 hypothetical protein [Pseudonocardiales bacterium]
MLTASTGAPAGIGGAGVTGGETGVAGVTEVAPQEPLARPSSPTELPHAVTGAEAGTWAVEPGLAAFGVTLLALQAPEPLPMALPQTVTGALTGAAAVVPLPDPVPVPLLGELPAGGAVLHDADPPPSTPAPFPQTITGVVTGACRDGLPEDDPAEGPAVEPPAALPAPGFGELGELGVEPAELRPSTPTALPDTVTGAVTGACTFELGDPDCPGLDVVEVVEVGDGVAVFTDTDMVADVGGGVTGCRGTEREFPLTSTGAVIASSAPVPPAVPLLGERS